MVGERYSEQLDAAITPSRAEVIRSKDLILARLNADGDGLDRAALVQVLNDQEGISHQSPPSPTM